MGIGLDSRDEKSKPPPSAATSQSIAAQRRNQEEHVAVATGGFMINALAPAAPPSGSGSGSNRAGLNSAARKFGNSGVRRSVG